jgi:hypothetical protein
MERFSRACVQHGRVIAVARKRDKNVYGWAGEWSGVRPPGHQADGYGHEPSH